MLIARCCTYYKAEFETVVKKICHNKLKTESKSVRLSYLVINNQLSTNFLNVTASSNQEWCPFANDLKERGSKSSLGTISLNCSRCCCLGWPVFVPSDPPVPLLIGKVCSASCWIVTVGRLIVKCCSSPFPTIQARFEVELACFRRQKKKIWVIFITFFNPTIFNRLTKAIS